MPNINLPNLSPDSPRPLIGNFELTRKCPLNCLICYNERRESPEMTLEEIKSYIDQLVDLGGLYINITGGDPLIHPHFCEVYEYCCEKGLRVSVETSCVYLKEEHIHVFQKYQPIILYISIYAVTKQTMHSVTQSQIDPNTVINNLQQLKANKVNFTLRTPFSRLNIHEAHLIERVANQLNVPYESTVKLFWKQSGERCVSWRCTSEDLQPLRKNGKIYEKLYQEAVILETKNIVRRPCYAGLYDFFINAYGELEFCITFSKPHYDLKKGTLRAAWEKWYPHYRRLRENYCIGKKLNIGPMDACPAWYILQHPDFDCSKSLNERVEDEIQRLRYDGLSTEEICEKLDITYRDYDYFNSNSTKKISKHWSLIYGGIKSSIHPPVFIDKDC